MLTLLTVRDGVPEFTRVRLEARKAWQWNQPLLSDKMFRMSKRAGVDLVEVLGGVGAEMAGKAVELLRRNGIPGDVRRQGMPGAVATWAGRLLTWDVQVPSRDAEHALELLAEGGFPSRRTEAVEVEREASDTSAADDSVKGFLKRGE